MGHHVILGTANMAKLLTDCTCSRTCITGKITTWHPFSPSSLHFNNQVTNISYVGQSHK